MRSIFISYRRGDAEGQAGRLFDDLAGHFGKTAVFMDVEDIEPGRDFRKVIDQHVSSCGVLLSLVGKGWLNAADNEGHRRLEDPNDFVRLETASALKRDIPVIPVLVQGANMPKAESLPDDLKEFAFRNAVELTHARWVSDVQLLIKALGRYVDTGNEQKEAVQTGSDETVKAVSTAAVIPVKESEAQPAKTAPSLQEGKMRWLPVMIAAIVVIALAAGGYNIYDNTKKVAEVQKAAEARTVAAQQEVAKAQMDAENAKKMAQQAEAEKLKAEEARKAAEKKAAAKVAAADPGNTPAGDRPTNIIHNITFNPPSGSVLHSNQNVYMSYSYRTTHANGVRICALPLVAGKTPQHYAPMCSPLNKARSGRGRCYFRIVSGNVTVDSVKITMLDSNRKVLLERVYPVSFEFKES